MKSSLKTLLAAAVLGLAALPAISIAQPPGGGGGRGGINAEREFARYEEGGVKLTAEQKTKVTAILTKAAADMQALPQDDTRRDKAMALRTAMEKEIKALLTPEQQAKFDALPAPQRGNRGGQGAQGGAPK